MKIGDIELEWLGHSGFLIRNGKSIYIDPYNLSLREPKADVILITHSHYDHCSISDIEKIAHPGTVVILTPDCQSKITKLENVEMQIMIPGDEISVKGVKIQAVPAYNNSSGFHTKSEEWNGYVLKFDKIIIYHAGDSDFTPEMQKLSGYGKQGNEFIALLPVGGKFTMDSVEAANAAAAIKPSVAIPMHYGSVVGTREDAEMFVKLCSEKGIKAQILEKM
ncbi:MAG: MBL fold metallo-hydrolase [Nanoarchaeota archaeon]|nr:MBL fold metallo-hydrolase [Nanoarchaeota archaeon]MBU4086757.1 MBL fold metallo-hydrolase [Nanoarchaeota archaeon]